MTGYEEKVYEKADDAQYMMAELERHYKMSRQNVQKIWYKNVH